MVHWKGCRSKPWSHWSRRWESHTTLSFFIIQIYCKTTDLAPSSICVPSEKLGLVVGKKYIISRQETAKYINSAKQNTARCLRDGWQFDKGMCSECSIFWVSNSLSPGSCQICQDKTFLKNMENSYTPKYAHSHIAHSLLSALECNQGTDQKPNLFRQQKGTLYFIPVQSPLPQLIFDMDHS